MLVIRVELHPNGYGGDRVVELGRMVIANVGGTDDEANYLVRARNGRRMGRPEALAAEGGLWAFATTQDVLEAPDHVGQVKRHPRRDAPVWSLLAKSLAAIGFRP